MRGGARKPGLDPFFEMREEPKRELFGITVGETSENRKEAGGIVGGVG